MNNDKGKMYYGVGLDNSQLRTDAAESKRILQGIGSTAKKEGDNIDAAIKKIGTAAAGVFAVSKLKEFVTQVSKVRGEFQQLEVAFKTMLGSADKADALMSQLIRTAAITPFGMSDIAQAAKQLLAYGVEAEKVNDTLIRLGDIAAGLSIPMGDLAYLYGTTMVQGRMYTQDLNQFLGRGIPLADELAKQFGVAKSQVRELVEAGKVGFPEVEKAIISMTSEGSKFGGLMTEQSKTISGQISNIEDSIEQMFNKIGKQSEGIINDTLGLVSDLVENWESIGKVLLVVISTYGAYKAAVIAVAAAHKIAAIWGQVQAFLSLTKSVTSAKDAMLLLNMAIKANPVGLILGVVAAAATAFSLFSKRTNEATEMTTKFGERAATTMTRVNTLTTTLNGLTTGTTTHKKVMGELNSILEEYGLQAIKEGDSIDMVNEKRKQAIELIKQEAIERQRANALEQGAEDYSRALADAQKRMSSALSGAVTGKTVLGTIWGSGNKEIQDNAAAISTIIASIVEQNITEIAGKTGDEYEKGLDKIYSEIQDRMRKIGISEKTIASTWWDDGFFRKSDVVGTYIYDLQRAKEQHDRYTEAVNRSADAEKTAADNSMTFAEKTAAVERSLQGANDGVHELYDNIKNLMSRYSENTVGFTIKFSGEVPEWMGKMSMDELQRLAKMYAALGTQSKDGAYIGGKYMSQQDLLQRGADYAQAAENKQQEADKKKREEEQNKKEREEAAKKAAAAAKKAAAEKQQIADETAERNRKIAEYGDSVMAQIRQTELDIRQEQINAMAEGYDKVKAQLNLNYDRMIAENDKRQQNMLDALLDKKVLEWENQNPKATKEQTLAYRASLNLTVEDLSAEQQAQLLAYQKIADEARVRGNKEALDTMLQDILTYEQQRAKVAEEYTKKRNSLYEIDADGNKKLRTGVTQGNIDELDRQEKEAYQSIDEQFAQREEIFRAWMNEIANLTLEQLLAVLKQAEDELKKLEGSGNASDQQLAVARAKVSTARKNVASAQAKNDVSPNKRSIKEWEDLYKVLVECEREFESIGDTVGGVAGEIIDTAGSITTASLSMINGIVQLINMSTTGIQGTAIVASKAIQTVEKASVILTIISAALQIATQIINLFNSDDKKQEEIEKLQERIDQLQWELDNADIVRLQESSGKAIDNVRQALQATYKELLQTKMAVGDVSGAFRLLFSNVTTNNDLLRESVNKLATAYGNVAYTADKALGNKKYEDSREQLENIAQQQLLIQEQINKEQSKKKTNNDDIKKYEQQIEELGAEAVQIINEMVEDIIGGTSSEIANELADAFFEAFQAGEDYAKAWGDKVNEIVADVIKRMLVSKFLEEPLGDVFNKYKAKWFKDGEFVGIDAVIESMSGFANDLNAIGGDFAEIWEVLPDSIKNMLAATDAATREASEKGIATASQESVDELNGRMTAVQGHTFSISENTKLLLVTTNLILESILNIESNTDTVTEKIGNVESHVKDVRDTVNNMALRGIKLQ